MSDSIEKLKGQGIIQISENIFYDTFSRMFVVAITKITVHLTLDEFFQLSSDIKNASKVAESVVMLSSILENNINKKKI